MGCWFWEKLTAKMLAHTRLRTCCCPSPTPPRYRPSSSGFSVSARTQHLNRLTQQPIAADAQRTSAEMLSSSLRSASQHLFAASMSLSLSLLCATEPSTQSPGADSVRPRTTQRSASIKLFVSSLPCRRASVGAAAVVPERQDRSIWHNPPTRVRDDLPTACYPCPNRVPTSYGAPSVPASLLLLLVKPTATWIAPLARHLGCSTERHQWERARVLPRRSR